MSHLKEINVYRSGFVSSVQMIKENFMDTGNRYINFWTLFVDAGLQNSKVSQSILRVKKCSSTTRSEKLIS